MRQPPVFFYGVTSVIEKSSMGTVSYRAQVRRYIVPAGTVSIKPFSSIVGPKKAFGTDLGVDTVNIPIAVLNIGCCAVLDFRGGRIASNAK